VLLPPLPSGGRTVAQGAGDGLEDRAGVNFRQLPPELHAKNHVREQPRRVVTAKGGRGERQRLGETADGGRRGPAQQGDGSAGNSS
jgi:hypothetical protein